MYASLSKLCTELKNGIEILVGQGVVDQNSQNIVLINNSRTTRPSQLLMLKFEFLGQFTVRCIYYFKKVVIIFR